MGVAHVTLIWKGGKPRTGIQAAAREARYGLMTEWCRANGATRLLTAHTQDDQAETVLMRLARTSSIESLAGIARHGAWEGVAVFRPLLGVAKSELRQFLAGLGQSWIDDPSNEDERFERVRVRKLMPALAAAGSIPAGWLNSPRSAPRYPRRSQARPASGSKTICGSSPPASAFSARVTWRNFPVRSRSR
ncbi:MAG: tRNA lysidine(34) synthetase TilS [Rhodospirillales bacterium]|nr:tRNA lysidine(34) synthetase TilS [Rhodospirillales bacterium]